MFGFKFDQISQKNILDGGQIVWGAGIEVNDLGWQKMARRGKLAIVWYACAKYRTLFTPSSRPRPPLFLGHDGKYKPVKPFQRARLVEFRLSHDLCLSKTLVTLGTYI